MEDAVGSLQANQPLSLMSADAATNKASLTVVGSVGFTQAHLPAVSGSGAEQPSKKGRVQAKLGRQSSAGQNKTLSLSATRFIKRCTSFLFQREEEDLHPFKALQEQPEWAMALLVQFCSLSNSASEYDSELVKKTVTK